MALFSVKTLALVVVLAVSCGASDTFKRGQKIAAYANKVGPFANPSETYPYYSMPFCQPEKLVYEDLDLGQILRGDRFVNTKFDIAFESNVHNRLLCHRTLDQEAQVKLKHAIDDDYYFELVVDELALFGFIGEKESMEETEGVKPAKDLQYFVFTHLDFAFYYNEENQIVDANVTTDQRYRAEIAGKHEGQTDVTFTYSIKWQPSDIHHSHRVEKYSMSGFRKQHIQIHWISIVNSCVLVILLTGFLALILLRILRNDISKIVEFDEDLEGERPDEDCGWKKISADVFRPPPYPMLLSALLGMGAQILTLVLAIVGLTSVGAMEPHARGAMHSNFVIVFTFTAGVAGFVAAYIYKKLGGDQERTWVWNVVLSGSLFPLPFFVVAMFNNSVAWSNGSTQALPFGTMMQVFFSWLLICMPFTVLGGFAGRRMSSPLDPPLQNHKSASRDSSRHVPAS
jgi:transmembrane 9 superfamily protein 1